MLVQFDEPNQISGSDGLRSRAGWLRRPMLLFSTLSWLGHGPHQK